MLFRSSSLEVSLRYVHVMIRCAGVGLQGWHTLCKRFSSKVVSGGIPGLEAGSCGADVVPSVGLERFAGSCQEVSLAGSCLNVVGWKLEAWWLVMVVVWSPCIAGSVTSCTIVCLCCQPVFINE